MKDSNERVERTSKPKKCPACGASPLATILYGMPAFTTELELKIKEGRVSLGGCCITGDDPVWECTKCGLKIYRKGK